MAGGEVVDDGAVVACRPLRPPDRQDVAGVDGCMGAGRRGFEVARNVRVGIVFGADEGVPGIDMSEIDIGGHPGARPSGTFASLSPSPYLPAGSRFRSSAPNGGHLRLFYLREIIWRRPPHHDRSRFLILVAGIVPGVAVQASAARLVGRLLAWRGGDHLRTISLVAIAPEPWRYRVQKRESQEQGTRHQRPPVCLSEHPCCLLS